MKPDLEPKPKPKPKPQSESGSNPVKKVDLINSEIRQATNIMTENIDLVLQRRDRLDALVDLSSEVNNEANVFKNTATSIKRTLFCKNIKLSIIIGVAIIIIIITLAIIIYFITK